MVIEDPAQRKYYAKKSQDPEWRADRARRARERYWMDPERHRKAARERRTEYTGPVRSHAANIRRVDEIKSKGSCHDCGGRFPPVCMDFDHRDPGTKHRNVAAMLSCRWSRIQREIDKCDLVCANCHRIRTAAKGGWRGGDCA